MTFHSTFSWMARLFLAVAVWCVLWLSGHLYAEGPAHPLKAGAATSNITLHLGASNGGVIARGAGGGEDAGNAIETAQEPGWIIERQ